MFLNPIWLPHNCNSQHQWWAFIRHSFHSQQDIHSWQYTGIVPACIICNHSLHWIWTSQATTWGWFIGLCILHRLSGSNHAEPTKD